MRSVIRSTQAMGSSLREARHSVALTQLELGRRTGLRQATISRLENGEGGTLESLFKLLSALKMDLHLEPRSADLPDPDDIF